MDEIVPHSSWKGSIGQPGVPRGPSPVPESPGLSITVEDIVYALWRHKWLIIFCFLLGLGGAAALYVLTPRLYHSEARVMLKSVLQRENLGPASADGPVVSVVPLDAAINAEVAIITSADLAAKVAEAVGPDKVLAKVGGGNDVDGAAAVIAGGVNAYAPPKDSVIRIIFQHPDRSVIQPVLSNLVAKYVVKHWELHRALSNLEEFETRLVEQRETVDRLNAGLRDYKRTNSVFSVEEARKAAADETESTAKALRNARSELLQVQGLLALLYKDRPPDITKLETEEELELRTKYAELVGRIRQSEQKKQLRRNEGYSDSSSWVTKHERDIAKLEAEKLEMEKAHPELGSLTSVISTNEPIDPRRVPYLTLQISVLSNRLTTALSNQARIDEVSQEILEREERLKKEKQAETYSETVLREAKMDAAIGASKYSNIVVVQKPTPPVLQLGSLYKKMGMAAAAGGGLGVALALLLELFLDQRVKRPSDVRKLVSAPLYMSIPFVRTREPARQLTEGSAAGVSMVPALSEKGARDRLQPYYEALRDRVMNRFDGLVRKPKLVGVSGCVGGATGATRLAVGLAGALAEAGGLKILLVDMKSYNGKPHPILGRRKSCSLADVLQHEREEAQLAPNLYLASAEATDPQTITRSSPKFAQSVPQMAASDYDYIVFDMPEVDQISITPRLAKHMDLMLLVVEAEKVHRGAVKEAGDLLTESTSNVAVVLSNTKAALPKSIRAT